MKLRYVECYDYQYDQFRHMGIGDPRKDLILGEVYEVEGEHVGQFHTEVYLKGFPGRWYNSVCFEKVKEDDGTNSKRNQGESKI